LPAMFQVRSQQESVKIPGDRFQGGLGFQVFHGEVVPPGRFQHHNPTAEVIAVGGQEFLVEELDAFAAKCFGSQVLLDSLEKFFFIPAIVVEIS